MATRGTFTSPTMRFSTIKKLNASLTDLVRTHFVQLFLHGYKSVNNSNHYFEDASFHLQPSEEYFTEFATWQPRFWKSLWKILYSF